MKLSLYYPVAPIFYNQYFGGNGEYYQKNNVPVVGHNGIDFRASHGQPVYAAHDGICYPEIDSKGGHGVVIRTLVPYDYNGVECYFKTIYWHFMQADAVVKTGQKVKAGDLIGYADNSGLSTGDHLHFGLKPQLWDETDWTWYNPAQENGYLGAIDPMPYLNGLSAASLNELKRNLYYGLSGDDVVRLQKLYIKLGHIAAGNATGYFGLKTFNATREFQRIQGISQVGCVGPVTRERLNTILATTSID